MERQLASLRFLNPVVIKVNGKDVTDEYEIDLEKGTVTLKAEHVPATVSVNLEHSFYRAPRQKAQWKRERSKFR